MRLPLETRRRILIPLLAGGLIALYLFVFLPLDRKAESLDAPLQQAWKKLASGLGQTNAMRLDFVTLTNQAKVIRSSLAAFENARRQAITRVMLDDALRARLAETFQLVDYDSESGRKMDELSRLARERKVTIENAVFSGFPEQRADMTDPALLWADLRFIECLMTAAINAKVTTIHSLSAPMPFAAISTNAPKAVAELPVQLELTGPIENVAKFLQTLPLRATEIKAAGLPDATTNKPALYIDHLLIRKQSPEKPDEVRLMLRAVGFVLRE